VFSTALATRTNKRGIVKELKKNYNIKMGIDENNLFFILKELMN